MLWMGFKKLHLQTTSKWSAGRKRQLFDPPPRAIKEHAQGRMSCHFGTASHGQGDLKAWVPKKFCTHHVLSLEVHCWLYVVPPHPLDRELQQVAVPMIHTETHFSLNHKHRRLMSSWKSLPLDEI